MTRTVFVSCAPGLEPRLAEEIGALLRGASRPRVERGGVAFEGGAAEIVHANLGLGLAAHVLVRIDRFSARHFSELERRVARLPWREIVREGAGWRVEAVSHRSRLYHTGGITSRIERAMAQSLGTGPSDAEDALVVRARLLRDRCQLSLDTSGVPLHRRGWRQQTGRAPLREDLARALVLASGWRPGQPLLDPMMGSGTLLIEAATMARGWLPGRLRRFAGEGSPFWCAQTEARLRARVPEGGAPVGRLVGRDRDPRAVAAAEGNALRAGVVDLLDLAVAEVGAAEEGLAEAWAALGPRGTLVCNPPFGRRVGGDRSTTRALLRRLGAGIEALGPGWDVALLLPDRGLAEATGVGLVPVLRTSHGGLGVEVMVRLGERSGG